MGAASLRFSAGTGAVTGNIAIRDAQGAVVRTMQNVTLRAGDQNVAWDGRDDRGNRAPDGAYSYEVAAKDARGEPVSVTTQLTGVVTGLEAGGIVVVRFAGDGTERKLMAEYAPITKV